MQTYPQNYHQALRVLGFDFGTKRIGVAFGQSFSSTAQALDIIPARDGIPDWKALEVLVTQWQPDAFVVGLPYNMDGSKSDLLLRARKFGNRLEGRLHKPCYGIDERLTSFEARGEVLQARRDGFDQKKHSDAVDSIAARLILETWFAGLPPLIE